MLAHTLFSHILHTDTLSDTSDYCQYQQCVPHTSRRSHILKLKSMLSLLWNSHDLAPKCLYCFISVLLPKWAWTWIWSNTLLMRWGMSVVTLKMIKLHDNLWPLKNMLGSLNTCLVNTGIARFFDTWGWVITVASLSIN